MSDGIGYDYAVGRIRALEIKLFDKSFLSRLEGADSALSCAVMLSEKGFPVFSFSEDDAGVRKYTDMLSDYEKAFLLELKSFLPEPSLCDIFLLKTDFSNLKLCIKSDVTDKSCLSANGLFTPEQCLKFYNSKDYSAFGSCASLISEAAGVYNTTRSGMKADCILDRAYYEAIREIASKSAFSTRRVLAKYINYMADVQNKKTYDRIVKRGGNIQFFNEAYIPGTAAVDKINSFRLPDSETEPEYAYIKNLSSDPLSCAAVLSYILCKKRDISNARVTLVKKLTGGVK